MPLEQRLKQPPEAAGAASSAATSSGLQSQSLSPTKLKVTRQKAEAPAAETSTNEEVCLRWNSHHTNMQNSFPSLLLKEQYVDVTLVAEGKILKCHRMILSSCSPYFEEILSGISPFQHPVLFMKDVSHWILKSLLDFMYAGEVHIYQDKLQELLSVAELLKIKGLAGKKAEEGAPKAPPPPQAVEPKTKPTEPKPKPVEPKGKQLKKEPQEPQKLKMEQRLKKLPLKKPSHTVDPLDLLQPLYEEPTKEVKPKIKEAKYLPRKTMGKGKMKGKRKASDMVDESVSYGVPIRKGTRSRPNLKVPKLYHPLYEQLSKAEMMEPQIERQPHVGVPKEPTQTKEPAVPTFVEPAEIKSEPIEFDSDAFEILDNNVRFGDYGDEQELEPQQEPPPQPEPQTTTKQEPNPEVPNFCITNVESLQVGENVRVNGTQIAGEPPDDEEPAGEEEEAAPPDQPPDLPEKSTTKNSASPVPTTNPE